VARTTKIQNLLARFADWSADHGFLGTLLALVYGAVAISFSAAAANETLKAIGWSGNESEREDFSIWVMAVVAAVVVLIIGFILQSYWWPFLISAPLLLVAFLTLGPYGSSMEEAFIGWMPLFFTIAGLGTAIFGGAGVIVGQRLYSSARFEAKARVWTVRLLAGVIGLMIFNVAATVVAHQFEQQDSQSNLRVQICGETVYGIAPIGDQLYLGSGDGIIAFDRVSLAVRWQFRTGGESVMSAPTVTNDRIFFGSHDGYVYSLDLSGNLIWRYYIGNWVFRSPVIADEMVYVGSAAKFVALDAATGTKQWELDLGTWVEISWSEVVGGMIYLGTANGELIALDATNGEERWRYQVSSITAIGTSTPESAPISAWIHDPPIVVDGVVYIASAIISSTPSTLLLGSSGGDSRQARRPIHPQWLSTVLSTRQATMATSTPLIPLQER
jgi:hypothetical protein